MKYKIGDQFKNSLTGDMVWEIKQGGNYVYMWSDELKEKWSGYILHTSNEEYIDQSKFNRITKCNDTFLVAYKFTKIEKPKPRFLMGQRFKINDAVYILAQTSGNTFCLINVSSGNRLINPVKIEDGSFCGLTHEQIARLADGHDFALIGALNLSKNYLIGMVLEGLITDLNLTQP